MRAPLSRNALAPLLLSLTIAWLGAACASGGPPAQDGAALNQRFLDSELDVGEWLDRFETESRDIYRARHAIVAELGLREGMRVADVGAGTGLFEPLFAEAVGISGTVYAIDIAPRFLAHLRRRTAEAGLSQVQVVEGTEVSIELPDASADVVFVCDTYHHFAQPAASLASIHHALRPGGTLVVVEFDRVPGKSRDWVLEHIRADKATFQAEIEAAGFALEREPAVAELEDNYMQVFRRVDTP
ncbi:MAG: methyltransferase domain-containing protein [Myxococcota bacterium]